MAKKIKFPLEMKNGVQVRNIEELRENFDVEKALGYLVDGKLQIWLQDRYYQAEADAIVELNIYDSNVKDALARILGVELEDMAEVDMEKIARHNEKIKMIKTITDDEEIWELVDSIAFDQEDLENLLRDKITPIYLCGKKFEVPYAIGNIEYIGINEPDVFIKASEKIDLSEKNISFQKVNILNEDIETGEELYQKGVWYLWERNGYPYDVEKAAECFKKASEKGHADAMARFAECAADALEEERNLWEIDEKEFHKILDKSVEMGSMYGKALKGVVLSLGCFGYEKNCKIGYGMMCEALEKGEPRACRDVHNLTPDSEIEKRMKVLLRGIELKSAWAANNLGMRYAEGDSVSQNYEEALRYFKLSTEFEENGYPEEGNGIQNLAHMTLNGMGTAADTEKAISLYKKACREIYVEYGTAGESAVALANIYLDKNDRELALEYAQKGSDWGNIEATFLLGRILCENGQLDNGYRKLVESANFQNAIQYAKDCVINWIDSECTYAHFAMKGVYFLKSVPKEQYSSQMEARICFINYDDLFNKKRNISCIASWLPDLSTTATHCEIGYIDSSVYIMLYTMDQIKAYHIDANNHSIISTHCISTSFSFGEFYLNVEGQGANTCAYFGYCGESVFYKYENEIVNTCYN